MYQKILVPLDSSDLAECTLFHVESLVKRGFAGEVVLLNIIKFDIPWAKLRAHMHELEILDIEKLREPLFNASKKYLAETASKLISKGVNVKIEVLEADRPADAIIEYAQKNGMDLIVMTTHGHGGFKKLILGNVAFSVLNESNIPVLLVRPESCHL
jgi:nucleotide-binding universal stress UspA family protein